MDCIDCGRKFNANASVGGKQNNLFLDRGERHAFTDLGGQPEWLCPFHTEGTPASDHRTTGALGHSYLGCSITDVCPIRDSFLPVLKGQKHFHSGADRCSCPEDGCS